MNTFTQGWLQHKAYVRLSDGKYIIYCNKLHTVRVTEAKESGMGPCISKNHLYNTSSLKENKYNRMISIVEHFASVIGTYACTEYPE
jgi:hypothetical protein